MNTSFDEFGFNKNLLKATKEVGYITPTPIQREVIPHIISGNDVIAKAQTGSGKTAAFGLPALQLLTQSADSTILIITPTRELALQVCAEMQKFSKYLNITPTAIYGGESINNQLQRLKHDSRILVGTPGRLLDLFRSKKLRHFAPKLIVLDEADEMLNMGFLEDIQSIFSFLPEERQTLLFSATFSTQIKNISKQFLKNPIFTDQSSKQETHDDIHQIYYQINERQRKLALTQMLLLHSPKKSIVFCNTKRQVEELSEELIQQGFSILSLHGDMSQKDRQISIDRFRKFPEKVLVATDVAGRGINVTDVSHVFNYDLPFSPDGYTHRIGRTGRMGNKGTAITFVSPRQTHALKKFIKTPNFKFSKLPTLEDINHQKQKQFKETLQQEEIHHDAENILNFLKQNNQKLEDVALRLISRYLRKETSAQSEKLLPPSEDTYTSHKKRQRPSHFKAPKKRFERKKFSRK